MADDDASAEDLLQQFLEGGSGDITAEDLEELEMLHRYLDEGGGIIDVDEQGFALDFDDADDDDLEVSEAATALRAANEEATLKDAPPLALTDGSGATETLESKGVVRLGGALTAQTAVALREHVLHELARLHDGVPSSSSSSGAPGDHFSAVLAPFGSRNAEEDDTAPAVCRFDLRLRLDPIVRTALRELLAGDVGAAMEAVAGVDAELYELAALVSKPGAAAQPLHADTLWTAGGCLYTSFVALQPVRREMGATRFVVGTHDREESHIAFDEGMDDGSFLETHGGAAACGLLDIGEATLYDGRLLHGGSANVCPSVADDGTRGDDDDDNAVRVLFYVTFRRAASDADELANDEAHSILERYRGRFALGELRGCAASRSGSGVPSRS